MDTESRVLVEDVMSTPLETVGKDATVQQAAERMDEANIKALVVRTHPPSIVTSTDVLTVAARGQHPEEIPIADVMTESVETVPPDIYIEEVAAMMTTFGINHLPVTDEDDEYIGMVSSSDVTRTMS